MIKGFGRLSFGRIGCSTELRLPPPFLSIDLEVNNSNCKDNCKDMQTCRWTNPICQMPQILSALNVLICKQLRLVKDACCGAITDSRIADNIHPSYSQWERMAVDEENLLRNRLMLQTFDNTQYIQAAAFSLLFSSLTCHANLLLCLKSLSFLFSYMFWTNDQRVCTVVSFLCLVPNALFLWINH